jgi:hypothetical protein
VERLLDVGHVVQRVVPVHEIVRSRVPDREGVLQMHRGTVFEPCRGELRGGGPGPHLRQLVEIEMLHQTRLNQPQLLAALAAADGDSARQRPIAGRGPDRAPDAELVLGAYRRVHVAAELLEVVPTPHDGGAGLAPPLPPHTSLQEAQHAVLRIRLGRGKGRPAGRAQTSTAPVSPMTPWVESSPRIISLCALPLGIIGKQFSCFSTTQSKITGPG